VLILPHEDLVALPLEGVATWVAYPAELLAGYASPFHGFGGGAGVTRYNIHLRNSRRGAVRPVSVPEGPFPGWQNPPLAHSCPGRLLRCECTMDVRAY